MCILILVGLFGKCQSIKKVGGRRFVEGLYQALFSFCLALLECYFESSEILGSHGDFSGDPGQSHTFDSEQIHGNSRASIPEKLHH